MNINNQLDVIVTFLAGLVLVGIILKNLYIFFKKISSKASNLTLAKNSKSASVASIKNSGEKYKHAILVISDSEEILFANWASAKMLNLPQGYTAQILRSTTPIKTANGKEIGIFEYLNLHKNALVQDKEFSEQLVLLTSKGEIPINIFLAVAEHTPLCYIVGLSDLLAERELDTMRNKYYLTLLPNQNRAIYNLGMMVSKMNSQDRSFALVLISIDNFSELRAMLGYQLMDGMIIEIADHLKFITSKKDGEIYHVMRNQFLLALPDIKNRDDAKDAVEEIKDGIKELYGYSKAKMKVTFSAGVSIFPKSGKSVDFLIDTAYKALSEAESHGGNYVMVDEEGAFSKSKNYESQLYGEMLNALERGEFELYYQPLVVMANEIVWGAEALIRWNHPKKGLISPAIFIPVAEKTGLIIEIGRFVIEDAIKQLKKWEMFKFDKLQISINLTLRELEDGKVVDFIAQMLDKYKISPVLLKFEITENIAMTNVEASKKEFARLKKLGVEIALDDFGTGYSSFEYLKEFSLDTLKIDRTFVTDLAHNNEHQKIVKAMIDLGHNFDLQVTAEGIEDKQTYAMLKEFGCDIAQGYYFSKPVPAHEFQAYVKKNSTLIH